jgi:hypothetical protein
VRYRIGKQCVEDLGAAHPNGIPDNYSSEFQPRYVSPIVNGADPGIPPFRSKTNIATNGWDVVYKPYCTGDVHLGNSVVTYTDPAGVQPPIVWRHSGYDNTKKALEYLATKFTGIQKLLVTGFSAGGTVTGAGYYLARRTLNPTVKGYMLNDSGPIFPAPNATYKSRPLHDLIKTQWGLATLYSSLPARQATVLTYWRQDQANLVNEMKKYANFSYHILWHRPINASHCSSIITFIGSHACPTVRKKYWYEIPIGQTWKCPSGNLPFNTFLANWINSNQKPRIVEPENYFNNEDPGMQIVAPLINDAIDG